MSYKCPECPKRFKSKSGLRRHKIAQHPFDPPIADVAAPHEEMVTDDQDARSKVPDFVYWEQDTPYLKELEADEASDYTYGTAANHVIIAGRYGVRTPAHNHIEVFAALKYTSIPTFGDEVDYDEIDLVGHRLQKVYDYSYTSDAECDARAVAQLRKHNATTKRGQITTLPNVGLQLFDVITVTDARAGISAQVYRVRGIEETFDTTKSPPIYRQIVDLGAR